MSPGQLPVSVTRMIEPRRFPFIVVVALLTLSAKAAGVRVLALVAAEAVLWNLLLEITAAVTILAVDARVCTFQGEPGFFLVIELGCLPTRGGVAATTLHAALASMYVVRCVA